MLYITLWKFVMLEYLWCMHTLMQVINSTYALWTWHRNQDIYSDPVGDQIYIVRQPDTCSRIMAGRKLDIKKH